jgi:putative transposase
MIETYKFRLYPTKEQEVLLAKHFGCVRFIYNWALDYDTKKYAQTQKHLGWISILNSGDYKKLKEDNVWLKEVNSQSLQNSVSHLDKAFQKFFRHQGGFPKFKSKRDNNQSFEIPANLKIDFKAKKIQIPKFLKTKNSDNRIKFVLSRKVKRGKIGTATVSRNPSGQYFISFIVHTNEQYPEFNREITKENSLGIDFGLTHFLNFSNGDKIDSPEFFKKALDKLKQEQRKLSKKQKGSKNKEKQRLKVAKVHQYISNQRNDFLHKLTTGLVKDSQFDVFCLEDLNLRGMCKLWGRKVSDLSYYTFQ